MRLSLSGRLFALMLTATVPLAVVLFYNLYSLRESKEREIHAEAFRIGQQAALEIQRIVGGVEDTLVAVSTSRVVQDFDVGQCNEYMAQVTRKLPQFSGIAVVDGQATIRCLQKPNGLGVSLADKPYIKETLETGRVSIGLFTRGKVSRELVLPISVPIQNSSGVILGAVAGSLSLDWLQRRLYERNFARNSAFTIADREGTILARFPNPEKFIGTRIPEEYQYLVQADKPDTTELTSQDGTRRIIAFFPPADSPSGLYVSVGLSTQDEYSAIQQAVYVGLAVTSIAIAIASLLAGLTAKYYIRRPVAKLVDTVRSWRENDETARSSLSEKDGEFGILSHAIDTYMDELEAARLQRQRDEEHRALLIGELDHRIKNLLATVQAVARQSFKSATLDPILLETFNARLAAMGDAHAVIIRNQWQTADLVDVVGAAVRPFDNPSASPFAILGRSIVIEANAALAIGMALHELCTNAVKYGSLSREEGRVDILWTVLIDDGSPLLRLNWTEMDGPPVEPPDRTGFGTLMIERMLGGQIGGRVDMEYAAAGLRCVINMPLPRASNRSEELRPGAFGEPGNGNQSTNAASP